MTRFGFTRQDNTFYESFLIFTEFAKKMLYTVLKIHKHSNNTEYFISQ